MCQLFSPINPGRPRDHRHNSCFLQILIHLAKRSSFIHSPTFSQSKRPQMARSSCRYWARLFPAIGSLQLLKQFLLRTLRMPRPVHPPRPTSLPKQFSSIAPAASFSFCQAIFAISQSSQRSELTSLPPRTLLFSHPILSAQPTSIISLSLKTLSPTQRIIRSWF